MVVGHGEQSDDQNRVALTRDERGETLCCPQAGNAEDDCGKAQCGGALSKCGDAEVPEDRVEEVVVVIRIAGEDLP